MARLYTPFNGPGGQSYLSDEDRLNAVRGEGDAARAAAAAELAARIQMHNADLAERGASRMQQGSMFERGLSSQEKEAQAGRDFDLGIFDKGTQRALGVADKANAVGLAQNQLEREKFQATNWRDQMARKLLESRVGGMMGNGAEGAQGGGGFQMKPEDESELLTSIMTGQPMRSSNAREVERLQLEAAKRGDAAARVAQYIDAGDLAAAEALGRQAGVAVNKPKFGNPDAALQDLTQSVGSFATKDNALVGWDPDMTDVNRLDAQANEAVRLLERDYKMPHDEAVRIVNQKIQGSVAGQRGLGTGWIDTLLQRRGLQ